MKCKDIQRLIFLSSEKSRSKTEKEILESHIRACPACAKAEEEMKALRTQLDTAVTSALPAELDRRTRMLCHDKLKEKWESGSLLKMQPIRPPIPGFIWAALTFLILITGIFTLPLIRELQSTKAFSSQTIFMLSLWIQNGVMLLLSPVILRKFREFRSARENMSREQKTLAALGH